MFRNHSVKPALVRPSPRGHRIYSGFLPPPRRRRSVQPFRSKATFLGALGVLLGAGMSAPSPASAATATVLYASPSGSGSSCSLSARSEEHTSELQSLAYLVCRLL